MQTHAMNILYTELFDLGPATTFQLTVPPSFGWTVGQGKTTTTAKLAEWYRKKHGLRVAVIEADVHRPGAYAQPQLSRHRPGVRGTRQQRRCVHCRNGLQACASADLVIVDTAGRHQLDEELVEELERIAGLTRATDRWLVIDAQSDRLPVRCCLVPLAGRRRAGIVITKLDGTARGGGALSAVAATGAPIVHIGVGERIRTWRIQSDRFISRLLGMGDIRVHRPGARRHGPEEAMRLTQRLSGRFTLNDMYKQMEMMSKVGTIDKLMSFLPGSMLGGMGAMSKSQKEAMQGNLDRYRTIMDSTTAWEKNEPARSRPTASSALPEGQAYEKRTCANSSVNGTAHAR